MATQAELMTAALVAMRKATYTPHKWCTQIDEQENYDWVNTWNFKAQQLMWQAAHANPNPAPQPMDLRDVQRCLFLTNDISRALETRNRLLIATADLGYRQFYTPSFIAQAIIEDRFRVWCDCRAWGEGTPPEVALQWLYDLGLSKEYFYGQCETPEEFDRAYEAGARKMVGNVGALHPNTPADPRHDQLDKVKSGEVHVTNETYFNVNPNYRVDWREAAGVGSNCMAVYESDRENAHYYSLVDQARDGKFNPRTDCVYVAGFLTSDWDYLIGT